MTKLQSWYDFPRYYDIACADETAGEVNFLEAAFRKYGQFPIRTVLEPACGTGRVTRELTRRGYRLAAFDLNEPALAWLQQQLRRSHLSARVYRADMERFMLARPVDAVACLFNSFRHLLTESAARNHLEAVARALKPGGLYILGFHLLPPDAAEECTERWTALRGRTRVSVTLRVTASSRRERRETLRVSLLAREGERERRVRDEFELRLYTARQFRSLLASVPALELLDVFDFWYDIEEPLALTNELGDAVFVLRRRSEKSRARSEPRRAP